MNDDTDNRRRDLSPQMQNRQLTRSRRRVGIEAHPSPLTCPAGTAEVAFDYSRLKVAISNALPSLARANIGFLSGQKASWIDVPISLLRTPHPANAVASGSSQREFEPISTDIVTALKLMLPSYLDERVPGIAEMAEITGTSVRSLQRELARAGLTYSRLLDQVRFEKGAELLRKTDARIIDIAFAAGYTDPAHFARAREFAIGCCGGRPGAKVRYRS
ncbi:helix-turn-helix transcriptional regulator [Bradyrhizobium sp. S3.2.12]|uniref:helix-turn-helix transcriptional regulator n=1 Tax=Bradyrhizobium sp. S3.2.12 TaxID=3156387 RepID=UPI00339812A8